MKRLPSLFGFAAVAVAAAMVLLAVSPVAATSGWHSPTMVWDGNYSVPAMALDSHGHAHIAARGDTGIWYLTNETGSWTRTRLTTDTGSGDTLVWAIDPAIAIDSSTGAITVAYSVVHSSDAPPCCAPILTYRTNQASSWSSPHTIPYCEHSASLVARGGKLYVAAERSSSFAPAQVWFCTNVSGSWTEQMLPQPNDGRTQFESPSLALDSHGKPHIAYVRFSGVDNDQVIWYASGSSSTGNFTREKISKSDVNGYGRPSLALNSSDQPRVAYVEGTITWFSYRNSTGWHPHAVMSGSGNAALVVDSDGPHIATTDATNVSLWYATQVGGAWETTQIDPTEGVGSLTIGAFGGRISVAYDTSESHSPRTWFIHSTP